MDKKVLEIIKKVKELLKDDKRLEWDDEYNINTNFSVKGDNMLLKSITFDWSEHLVFHERICVYPDKIVFSSTFGIQEVLLEYKNWNELLSK